MPSMTSINKTILEAACKISKEITLKMSQAYGKSFVWVYNEM